MISFVISLMGFLNAKLIFVSSSIGLFLALIAMINILGRHATGWEDLIGPIVFLEVTGLAFAVGVVLELSVRVIKRSREKKI